jgi:hypothetical protein
MQHNQGITGSHWTLSMDDYSLRIGPGGSQGDNQQNNDVKFTQFAGHFDGHRDARVQCCALCLMEEVRGFRKSH